MMANGQFGNGQIDESFGHQMAWPQPGYASNAPFYGSGSMDHAYGQRYGRRIDNGAAANNGHQYIDGRHLHSPQRYVQWYGNGHPNGQQHELVNPQYAQMYGGPGYYPTNAYYDHSNTAAFGRATSDGTAVKKSDTATLTDPMKSRVHVMESLAWIMDPGCWDSIHPLYREKWADYMETFLLKLVNPPDGSQYASLNANRACVAFVMDVFRHSPMSSISRQLKLKEAIDSMLTSVLQSPRATHINSEHTLYRRIDEVASLKATLQETLKKKQQHRADPNH